MGMPNIGDFSVGAYQQRLARDQQDTRSPEARAQDAEKRAPVTTNFAAWADDPDHLDFPGIDTPSESPHVLPKDQMDPVPTTPTRAARNDKPSQPLEQAPAASKEMDLVRNDVPASPEEVFGGVGATSDRAAGGFDSVRGGEIRPLDEPDDIF